MTGRRIVPAILAGGRGERLAPLSTEARPKQFRAFAAAGAGTLFQQAVQRLSGAHADIEFTAPVVLCGALHRALALAQLGAIGVEPARLVLEPVGRNTAAAAVIAAALAQEIAPGALVLLSPADHAISDVAALRRALACGAAVADQRIVTFGAAPTCADTGYGYIELGAGIAPGVHAIAAFHEKPGAERAARYAATSEFRWNCGLFLATPELLLGESARAEAIREGALAALRHGSRDAAAITLCEAYFARIESAPLDRAVMEKTPRGAVVPCNMGWADLGSWREVWRLSPCAEDGACVVGPALPGDLQTLRAAAELEGAPQLRLRIAGDRVLISPR